MKIQSNKLLYCILFLHQTTTGVVKQITEKTLYCILFLHQTTTVFKSHEQWLQLYCILFLHQTTTVRCAEAIGKLLYCILFLHQTTTWFWFLITLQSCIASSFYIKPQLHIVMAVEQSVVLHPLSTSNHNWMDAALWPHRVVLHPLSTSNHNPRTPDTLIFGHLTASRHDTKRGGVHRGSRFDAVFTFSTNIRKIIFTEIRRCMSVQRAGARLRSDSSEANI